MKIVGQPIPKLDSIALTTGQGVYTEDLTPVNCLVVKIVRSPHARAKILSIKYDSAIRVPGIECILTWKDMPQIRYTLAGQTYPEVSPYDRYILEQEVRYVGDPVVIVAGITQQAVDKAIRMIHIKYKLLEPVLDFEQSLDHKQIVHRETDYFHHFDIGGNTKRNLIASNSITNGDLNTVFSQCDEIVEETYYTKANAQAMMETFRTYSYMDSNHRLVVVTSTQVPFHCRRIIARALGLPQSSVRVIKPRIGGGFGAKQTLVSELFPCIVTLKTGKPAKIIFTRKESFMASNSRHQMRVKVKLGAMKDGTVNAVSLQVLSNGGAYGEHASTTVGLVGTKNIPLYTPKAFHFGYDVVYTNTMAGGAFRGYGATQGCFALESAVNELAYRLHLDSSEIRLKNIPHQGDFMPAYQDGGLSSSRLDECICRGRELIGWNEKYSHIKVNNHTIRGVGMAITMQGSGIAGIDTCAATIRLNDSGFYTLFIGATDMGTGCDTILAQMAAEILKCPLSQITVDGVDTDHSPFDPGSYASATTYVTGTAVANACRELMEKILFHGAKALQLPVNMVEFDGKMIYSTVNSEHHISLNKLAESLVIGNGCWLQCTSTHSSPVSPPPLIAGFAEVEVDTGTGQVKVIDYVAVVDCGTVINPNLATVQTQGGIAQGIGMALFEDIQYNSNGRMLNDSFMQYKIPSRLDLPDIRVEFMPSYEPSGPFGAKSIGEVVINTPCPAIADAVFNAVGVRVRSLPITSEKVLLGIKALQQNAEK